MRLIQAKVSDELFREFSHYLVDRDLTVGEAVSEWIEKHCGVVELGGVSSVEVVKSSAYVSTDKPKVVKREGSGLSGGETLREGYLAGKVCGCGEAIADDDPHFSCGKCRQGGGK